MATSMTSTSIPAPRRPAKGIFIDSSITREIQKYFDMGVIRGVTTNPTIMLKDGVKGGLNGIKDKSIEIASLVHPYPVSVEVLSNDPVQMMEQAQEFSQWAPNINVKITIHGPHGELENLEVVHQLESSGVRVNVTAMMSAQQCFLAAQAGASFISLFCGRINNMGYDSRVEIKKIRGLVEDFSLRSRIIACSVREAINVTQWLESGAHIVTVPPPFFPAMLVHPYSKETVQMFLDDAAQLEPYFDSK